LEIKTMCIKKKTIQLILLGGGVIAAIGTGLSGLSIGETLTAITGLAAIAHTETVPTALLAFIAIFSAGFVYLMVKALLAMDYDCDIEQEERFGTKFKNNARP